MAVCTIPFALVMVWRVYMALFVPDARVFDSVDLVILMGLVVCGGLAVFGLGLAIRRPVGLRIDGQGLSGYCTPSLSWDEIDGVEARSFHKGHGVAVKLSDPGAFWARQSAWFRLRSLGRVSPFFVINTTYLRVRPEDIAADIDKQLTCKS